MGGTATSFRIATRGSALALWQADFVAGELRRALALPGYSRTTGVLARAVELVVVSTEGDRRAEVPLTQIGGKGVFVKEVQAAVLDGRADLAVHSAKDLPAQTPDGLVIAAVPLRADPRDVLVGAPLADLGVGAVVASGSPRRRAQLLDLRPDLRLAELRGNIDTRLEKASRFDAIIVAAAALDRLGRTPPRCEILPPDIMIPQVGQGALAVECRTGDLPLRALLEGLDHPPSRRELESERAFLDRLGGDCDLPAGAFAVAGANGDLTVAAMLAADRVVHRRRVTGSDGVALGRAVAEDLLAAVARAASGPPDR